MDPLIQDLLNEGGLTALKELIQGFLKSRAEKKKEKLSQAEQKKIAAAADKMVRAATEDEIRKFGSNYQVVKAHVKPHGGVAKRGLPNSVGPPNVPRPRKRQ
jgi:hypothetical protein